jgi:RimJ/RimL family protein N-acetyltransferase
VSAPPKTVLVVTPEEEAAIRDRVRKADPASFGPTAVIAGPSHVPALVEFLSDPAVSGPIYDLPRPINDETVAQWVEGAERRRQAGEALLFLRMDDTGRIASYSLITVWPDRSSAELVGAQRADLQNSGVGRHGAARTFGWMFETLGVRLIGLTAALDNVRSAKVIEAAGFVDMGERDSMRPDGTTRRSRYWELTSEQWRARSVPRPQNR